ncbi:MAG: HAMP domain-containing sensor histidine kinase [Candidatus Omnitrophota bacterium]
MQPGANGDVNHDSAYRRIFGLIIAALALFLSIGLPITGYKIVHEFRLILFHQVMRDNDAISLWFERYFQESRTIYSTQDEWLENIRRYLLSIKIPGDGYICVVDAGSNLRASPDCQSDGDILSMKNYQVTPFDDEEEDFDEKGNITIAQFLDSPRIAKIAGRLKSPNGDQLVEFRRIEIGGEAWLIGVHQFESAVEKRLTEHSSFILYWGFVLFLIVVIPFAILSAALMRHHEKERSSYIERIERHSQEYQKTALQLQESNRSLNLLQEQKNRLYSRLSHDLRTPLNSILGACTLLSDGVYGEVTKRQRDAMTSVERNVDVLLKLIDGILHLSRLESGGVKVEKSEFPLDNLLDEVAENVYPLAENKNLLLSIHSDPSTPIISSDRDKLYLILQNLLANSIKFTEKGYVELSVNRFEDAGVSITIEDTGPGIKLDEQEKIFQEFSQGENAEKGEGFGLGLAITKELTQLLGGRIELESGNGQGARFTVIFPDCIPETAQSETSA